MRSFRYPLASALDAVLRRESAAAAIHASAVRRLSGLEHAAAPPLPVNGPAWLYAATAETSEHARRARERVVARARAAAGDARRDLAAQWALRTRLERDRARRLAAFGRARVRAAERVALPRARVRGPFASSQEIDVR
jgi:hypothetical protein